MAGLFVVGAKLCWLKANGSRRTGYKPARWGQAKRHPYGVPRYNLYIPFLPNETSLRDSFDGVAILYIFSLIPIDGSILRHELLGAPLGAFHLVAMRNFLNTLNPFRGDKAIDVRVANHLNDAHELRCAKLARVGVNTSAPLYS